MMHIVHLVKIINEKIPIFAIFLIFCSATSFLLSALNIPLLAKRFISALNGKQSAVTLAFLDASPSSSSFLYTGIILAILGGTIFRNKIFFLKQVDKFTCYILPTNSNDQDRNALESQKSLGFLLLTCLCLLLSFGQYWPTLMHGYFRYDDFELIATASNYPLSEALLSVHGDHFMPLTRVFAAVSWRLFGASAGLYNFFLLLIFCLNALFGSLILNKFNVCIIGKVIFIVLLTCWSPWCVLLDGYYTLMIYTVILLFSLSSILCYLRWRATKRHRYAFLASICVISACLMDIAGWYTPAIFGVFLMLSFHQCSDTQDRRLWVRQHRYLIPLLATGLVLVMCWTTYCYSHVNPGKFMSMGGLGRRGFLDVLLEWGHLLSAGLLLSMGIPFVYARIPSFILLPLLALTSCSFAAVLIYASRRATQQTRLALCGMTIITLGVSLEVSLGRAAPQTSSWPANYLCPSYFWLCMLISTAWSAIFARLNVRWHNVAAQATLVTLLLFVAAQKAVGYLGMAVDWPPIGYEAGIRDAKTRRASVRELGNSVFGSEPNQSQSPIKIPVLGGEFINTNFRSLASYDLTAYMPFLNPKSNGFTLLRAPYMQCDNRNAVMVPSLKDAVSPEFLSALRTSQNLQNLYFANVSLRGAPFPRQGEVSASFDSIENFEDITHQEDGSALLTSSGEGSIWVKREQWEPETAPQLRIGIQCTSEPTIQEFPIAVSFQSSFRGVTSRSQLLIHNQSNSITVVDLRQLYAFALSDTVEGLRITLVQPGRYQIWLLDIAQ